MGGRGGIAQLRTAPRAKSRISQIQDARHALAPGCHALFTLPSDALDSGHSSIMPFTRTATLPSQCNGQIEENGQSRLHAVSKGDTVLLGHGRPTKE